MNLSSLTVSGQQEKGSKFHRIQVTIRIAVITNAIVKIDHLRLAIISHIQKIKILRFFFADKVDNTDRGTVDFIVMKTFGRINTIVV